MTTTAPPPVMQRQSAYQIWGQKQNIPIVTGFYIADVNDIEVKPWDLMGVPGAIVDLEGCGGTNSAYALEIPAGQSTTPIKHMIEILCYVTKGRGATTVWLSDDQARIPVRIRSRLSVGTLDMSLRSRS